MMVMALRYGCTRLSVKEIKNFVQFCKRTMSLMFAVNGKYDELLTLVKKRKSGFGFFVEIYLIVCSDALTRELKIRELEVYDSYFRS